MNQSQHRQNILQPIPASRRYPAIHKACRIQFPEFPTGLSIFSKRRYVTLKQKNRQLWRRNKNKNGGKVSNAILWREFINAEIKCEPLAGNLPNKLCIYCEPVLIWM